MRRNIFLATVLFLLQRQAWCASGTEGASFLDIPVGGAPAALGSAYTAQANDVYAPVWNPAGLGFLHSAEFTGTHVSYLGPVYYEHAGFVVPVGKSDESNSRPAGLGTSIQYLGTNSIAARDENGNLDGSFTSDFVAYTLSYGQKIMDKLSLGASGKIITEKISDASASAYAADLGLLYKPTSRLSIGTVVANMGSKIKFVNEGDSLPLAGRLGATYQVDPSLDISVEGVYRESGLASGSAGVEWRYDMISLRAGYNSARITQLGGSAGLTAGLGLFFWGQEFSYAYVPVGDLGDTHYFSFVFRWSTNARPEHPRLKRSQDSEFDQMKTDDTTNANDIFDFLNGHESKSDE